MFKVNNINTRTNPGMTCMAEDCPGIELNSLSLETVDTVKAKWSSVDSVITKIRIGWSKFRDSVLSLASRGLPLEANGSFTQCYVIWKRDLAS